MNSKVAKIHQAMRALNVRLPVIGFAAPSGSGKTTLLSGVIRELIGRGRCVAVIKQARDDFDLDQPGKDSHRLRAAGVERLLLASEHQSALIVEHSQPREPQLAELVTQLADDELDLVLVEGFRDQPLPKIEVYRGQPQPRYPYDPWVIAVASDRALASELPQFDVAAPVAVALFIDNLLATLRCCANDHSVTLTAPLDGNDGRGRRSSAK